MPANKRAIILYHLLDKCFSNPLCRYCINDLLNEGYKAHYEQSGICEGIKL